MESLEKARQLFNQKHVIYKDQLGTISNILKVTDDVYANISFIDNTSKIIALKFAFNKNLISCDDLKESLESLQSDFEEYKVKAEIEEKTRQEKVLAQREKDNAEYKAYLLEEQAKKRIERQLKKLGDLKNPNFYISNENLKWLKENITSITAVIPSDLEFWFTKHFGDAPHSVIDSAKKTSGGYKMQFNASFKLKVKNAKDIPVDLQQYFTNNTLANTQFIYNLIQNYGLEYGFTFFNSKSRGVA